MKTLILLLLSLTSLVFAGTPTHHLYSSYCISDFDSNFQQKQVVISMNMDGITPAMISYKILYSPIAGVLLSADQFSVEEMFARINIEKNVFISFSNSDYEFFGSTVIDKEITLSTQLSRNGSALWTDKKTGVKSPMSCLVIFRD